MGKSFYLSRSQNKNMFRSCLVLLLCLLGHLAADQRKYTLYFLCLIRNGAFLGSQTRVLRNDEGDHFITNSCIFAP